MARFRFRLEASLHLAEQTLETAQREFAQEAQRWQALVNASELQQKRVEDAQAGQLDAGRHRPGDLRLWQPFSVEQHRQLLVCQAEQLKQELVMEKARQCLLEAHREVEKFENLKVKQLKAFQLAESQREQKIMDETGQVLHWRQQKANFKH